MDIPGSDRGAEVAGGPTEVASGSRSESLAGPDAGPDAELAGEVAAAFERLVRVFRQLGQRSDLSIVAVSTLSALDRTGPHRLTDLAVREGVTQPAMTQLISRLSDADLVTRAADPTDGRVVRVHITGAGRATLAHRRAVRTRRVAGLLAELGPDERAAIVAALPAIGAFADLVSDDRPRPLPMPASPDTAANDTGKDTAKDTGSTPGSRGMKNKRNGAPA